MDIRGDEQWHGGVVEALIAHMADRERAEDEQDDEAPGVNAAGPCDAEKNDPRGQRDVEQREKPEVARQPLGVDERAAADERSHADGRDQASPAPRIHQQRGHAPGR